MVTLDEINKLRQKEKWEEITEKCQEHLKDTPDESFVLRALAQAYEKTNQKNEDYETTLYKLLEIKDRPVETAQKLSQYFLDNGEKEEAIRHLEISIEFAVHERQYDALEDAWMKMSDLEPEYIDFFSKIADNLNEIKQHQRAAVLLEMLLPAAEDRGDWKGRIALLKKIFDLNPKEADLREMFIDTFQKAYAESDFIEKVIDFCALKKNRPLIEAVDDVQLFMSFVPDSYVRHPDWGIGRVKDLNLKSKRVKINFQRKRDHMMSLELAQKAVEPLASDDFRVQKVINRKNLITQLREEPTEFIKNLLKSFGGTMNAKEIKENIVPDLINVREWTSWWSNTNTALKKDQFISVSGGSSKRYILREQAVSDEEELLQRFDETKAPHTKVDQIYTYLRTTKKADVHEHVIRHFSKKIEAILPRRKSLAERVELWFTNEDLKKYCESLSSYPDELLLGTLTKDSQITRTLQHLRFKSHQHKYAEVLRKYKPDDWHDFYEKLLLEPDVMIRDELAKALLENEQENRVLSVVETTIANFRQYPSTFIWISNQVLVHKVNWLEGRLTNPVVIERLLLLVDYLTSQAKRREKDEAVYLRKVAGDAREIIRRNHYTLFKENIIDADESIAQSIYRRAQTNEGLDARTAADLTSFVRARFPDLFMTSTQEESSVPEGVLSLRKTYEEKQKLLRRMIEIDLPEVVQEIETARQHGDLKENAEYHAAREKQKLLSSQVSELKDAIETAQPVDWENITTEEIGYGSIFRVTPFGSEAEEEYIMMGPWESTPEVQILSYQAPFARAFMGKKVGENVEIELPTHTGRYEVKSIDPLTEDIYDQLKAKALGLTEDKLNVEVKIETT
jgi:transcription elongation factor GreA-like protein/transcription elongation GreA/GreB family factor